ncbi:MAG: NADH-quinone oxidoreductase subunit NuoK [bacterium]|nr:NADH-quinone oxidoreductase subunit NuoK [bacterium]
MVPLSHYLILGAILFCIGIYGALTRRNAVGILMSIELIINAANINLVAFSRFMNPAEGTGQIFAIFTIGLAAAAAAVGLAIVISIYRNAKTVYVDKTNLMKW